MPPSSSGSADAFRPRASPIEREGLSVDSAVTRAVQALMRYELQSTFRRMAWMSGTLPDLPAGTPVVCYANHHHFYDGHFLWWLLEHVVHRQGTIWMNEWEKFPFFAAVGAQPFPPDDPSQRAATVRRTARRFRDDPETVLVYFPEAELHAPGEGIRPFPDGATERLGRLYPDAVWWPVAIHVTYWGDKYPTVCLRGGSVHDTPDGAERDRLANLWHTLRDTSPAEPHEVLIEGRRSPSDVFDFAFTASFFERYL